MSGIVAKAEQVAHPQRLEDVRPAMAKATVRKVEDGREAHGRVLARSIQLAGLSQKEAAAALGTDESTLNRWLKAKESQQTWRFEQHAIIGPAYLLAQAEKRADEDSAVQVVTTVNIRRRA